MSLEIRETSGAAARQSTFFRQGGWMMISAVLGGALMFGVQVISKKYLTSDEEYSAFAVMVALINWMTIPALGLQMVFSQQAAAALNDLKQRQLVSTMKAVSLWTFGIWVVMVLGCIVFQPQLNAALKLPNPIALWITVAVGLVMLWFPIYQGLLQGRQNFLWLGWANILNGVGRVGFGWFIVVILLDKAAGLMTAVLIGLLLALLTAAWKNFDLWRSPGAAFDRIGWLKRVVPLTLGFGASQFLFSADAIAVQNFFAQNGRADYLFAATLCRAIVLFTAPLAAVMFPKLVHSRASAQKTNLLGLTLLATGALSLFGALSLSLLAPFIMKIFSKSHDTFIVGLIPIFAGAMVPLGMANVLLNHLMAHSRFKVVPVLVLLVGGYWLALLKFHDSFKMVVETFGVFSLAFLAVCALFTWALDKDQPAEPAV